MSVALLIIIITATRLIRCVALVHQCWFFVPNNGAAFLPIPTLPTRCKLEVWFIGVQHIDHLKALEQSATGLRARRSTEGWEPALNIAEDCRKKVMENVTAIEDMEVRSMEALELLTKR